MGQRGSDIAAEYIATQFAFDGLKPAGDQGTYFQEVPMVSITTLPDTTASLVPKNGEPLQLKNLDDFVIHNETQTDVADIDAPIVFVGYGITAPEYKWDDYKGVDLKGKVALLFVNEPTSDDPKFFKGKALTYYGRWTYKYEETARHGAVATLIIHRRDLASYGWEVVRNSNGKDKSYLRLGWHPTLARRVLDSTGRRQKIGGYVANGHRQDVSASPIARFQTRRITSAPEGPRRQHRPSV